MSRLITYENVGEKGKTEKNETHPLHKTFVPFSR